MFIKSPNSKHNVGEEREKWIPNPKANSLSDLDNFYKLGYFISVAFKQQECLNLSLPSILWKFILNRSIEWEDVKLVNLNQAVCLEKILSMSETDISYLDETFTTFLGDGKEFELEVGGKTKKLTAANKHEYVEKSKQVHVQALSTAFEMIRRGFVESTFSYATRDLTAEELDKWICGMNYVSLHHPG